MLRLRRKNSLCSCRGGSLRPPEQGAERKLLSSVIKTVILFFAATECKTRLPCRRALKPRPYGVQQNLNCFRSRKAGVIPLAGEMSRSDKGVRDSENLPSPCMRLLYRREQARALPFLSSAFMLRYRNRLYGMTYSRFRNSTPFCFLYYTILYNIKTFI